MDWARQVIEFVQERPDRFFELVWAHLRLSLTALALAVLIYVPLGTLFSRLPRIGANAVGLVSALRVIPSLALVFLFYPWLGFGTQPALVALVVLAAPALVVNTYAGLTNVDAATLEAARGLGMNDAHVFLRVQLPLALPVIIAGMRLAAVEILASATLASFVGAKTLGQYILTGISLLDTTYLLVGGIPIVLLVLATDLVFGGIERLVTPPTTTT
ncbi:MAG TPA: ABC transporter permease [Thermomicrobiales bacterium]|jgi:osmoprotectant transport system permease protein|nr:ABC transporter permease [Thermomicrobiales bacterium]